MMTFWRSHAASEASSVGCCCCSPGVCCVGASPDCDGLGAATSCWDASLAAATGCACCSTDSELRDSACWVRTVVRTVVARTTQQGTRAKVPCCRPGCSRGRTAGQAMGAAAGVARRWAAKLGLAPPHRPPNAVNCWIAAGASQCAWAKAREPGCGCTRSNFAAPPSKCDWVRNGSVIERELFVCLQRGNCCARRSRRRDISCASESERACRTHDTRYGKLRLRVSLHARASAWPETHKPMRHVASRAVTAQFRSTS